MNESAPQGEPGQRAEFQMTEAQLAALMEAGKPTPAIWGSGGAALVSTPQENANRAWQQLADELGFVWDTVAPVSGKGQRTFSAVARAATQAASSVALNQCDGCARGLPVNESGAHRGPGALDLRACTASRYAAPALRMLTDGELEAVCGRFHDPAKVRAGIRKFCEVNGFAPPVAQQAGSTQ